MTPEWNWHCADHALLAVGRNLWAELGIAPRDARSAAAVMRRLGVRSFKDAVTAVFGPPVSPLQARRGDIVMVDNALGICRGEWIECLDHMQPLRRAECAWRVGR